MIKVVNQYDAIVLCKYSIRYMLFVVKAVVRYNYVDTELPLGKRLNQTCDGNDPSYLTLRLRAI